MDTNRDIIYRGFKLNDSAIDTTIVPGAGAGSGIQGCMVSSFDLSDVDIVQFLEKRSESDGMDSGSVFQGVRRIRMSGTLYGLTRGDLFDRYMTMRSAMSPVLAQRESPADKGYRPLYFSMPTNRVTDYPAGAIDYQVLAMPRAFQATWSDSAQGGSDVDSVALSWQATFICKDPQITGATTQDTTINTKVAVTGGTASAATDLITKATHGLTAGTRVTFNSLTGGTGLSTGIHYYVLAAGLTANAFAVSTTSGGAAVNITVDYSALQYVVATTQAGNTVNRGSYICPVNALWSVGGQAGTIVFTVGDSAFTLNIPASSNNRIIRYKGQDKIVTIEELGVELLRMDVLAFSGLKTHPVIPTGTVAYSMAIYGLVVNSGSHFWFWESHA